MEIYFYNWRFNGMHWGKKSPAGFPGSISFFFFLLDLEDLNSVFKNKCK